MNNNIDRRAEFDDVMWQQGRLLLTKHTSLWPEDERINANEIEKRTAFAFFTEEDAGRSRERLFTFSSSEECLSAVLSHNLTVRSRAA